MQCSPATHIPPAIGVHFGPCMPRGKHTHTTYFDRTTANYQVSHNFVLRYERPHANSVEKLIKSCPTVQLY